MSGLNHKINNSYESDPLSSNGSSTDSASLDKSIDCTSQTQLSKLINRNLLKENENALNCQGNDQSSPKGYQCQIRPKIIKNLIDQNSKKNHSSAESSDFEGFSDGSTTRSQPQKSLKSLSSNESDFEGFPPPSEKIKLTQESTVSDSSKFSSEEISDQDARFDKEITNKNLDFLLNDHLQEITDFSIEPSSSENDERKTSATIMFHEENAVDNTISKDNNQKEHTNGNVLSFDGKIQGISTKTVNIPHVNLNVFDGDSNSRQINEQSPPLFDDTDEDDDNYDESNIVNDTDETDDTLTVDMSKIDQEDNNNVLNTEKRLLKKIQTNLSGVVPPPSVTILQMDLSKMLAMYNTNQNQCNENPIESASAPEDYLYRQSHSIDEIKQMQWPQVHQAYAHGIHYNRSVESEKIELLCLKYVERNIGAETSSSFTINTSPSSAKKRTMRTKMLSQSPGNRLSHLAKRRAVFSSANLLTCSQTLPSSKLGNKPLIIDTRKMDRKGRCKKRTPKRYTPGKRKTPGRKTPASERKRGLSKTITSTRESSRRALFQSPAKEKPKIVLRPDVAIRVDKSRRVLFSPAKSNESRTNFQIPPLRSEITLKRKRDDDNGFVNVDSLAKIQRTNSNLTPHSTLKLAKSQSFCVGSIATAAITDKLSDKSLFRASSETVLTSSTLQLTDSQRQKLLWAVSTSLKKKQISSTHLKFKYYAANLAKVVRRLFLETETKNVKISTSTTLLKIADKVVFWVLQDKTVDEIYLMEKCRIEKNKKSLPKLSGYIAPEDYEERKKQLKMTNSSFFSSENSWDSFSGQSQQSLLAQSVTYSQNCELDLSSQSSFMSNISSKSYLNESISMCDSQTKSNGTINNVLRENVDTDQRPKSGQKNISFSGKNQKNISPYSDRVRTTTSMTKHNSVFLTNANVLKAKRQISFDA